MNNLVENYIINNMQSYFQEKLENKLEVFLQDDLNFEESKFIFSEMREQFEKLKEILCNENTIILNIEEDDESSYKIWHFIPEIMITEYQISIKIILFMKMRNGKLHKIIIR